MTTRAADTVLEGPARKKSLTGPLAESFAAMSVLSAPQSMGSLDVTLNLGLNGILENATPSTAASTDTGRSDTQPDQQPDQQPEAEASSVPELSKADSDNESDDSGGSKDDAQVAGEPKPVQKKRTRATPEQLAVLEETFMTNTSPNAKLREVLAKKVNMSERSIQIWFQNRRAKVKLMQKRAAQAAAQEQALRAQSYFAYLPGGMSTGMYPFKVAPFYPQAGMPPKLPLARSSSVDFGSTFMNGLGGAAADGGSPGLHATGPTPGFSFQQPTDMPSVGDAPLQGVGTTKDMSNAILLKGLPGVPPGVAMGDKLFVPFTCDTLMIGSWRRVSITTNDLVCAFNLREKILRWQIVEGSSKFKMELPFDAIIAVNFDSHDAFTGELTFELCHAPTFFMEMGAGWTQCRDFTEGKQASSIFFHTLKGQLQALKHELLMIMQADPAIHHVARIGASSSAGSPTPQLSFAPKANRRSSCPDPTAFNAGTVDFLGNRVRRTASLPNRIPEERPLNRLGGMANISESSGSVETKSASDISSPSITQNPQVVDPTSAVVAEPLSLAPQSADDLSALDVFKDSTTGMLPTMPFPQSHNNSAMQMLPIEEQTGVMNALGAAAPATSASLDAFLGMSGDYLTDLLDPNLGGTSANSQVLAVGQ